MVDGWNVASTASSWFVNTKTETFSDASSEDRAEQSLNGVQYSRSHDLTITENDHAQQREGRLALETQ